MGNLGKNELFWGESAQQQLSQQEMCVCNKSRLPSPGLLMLELGLAPGLIHARPRLFLVFGFETWKAEAKGALSEVLSLAGSGGVSWWLLEREVRSRSWHSLLRLPCSGAWKS